ncbi:MAG: ribonuclease HI [Flavobacteriaceae bacterium]|jgi:ribonuclease HI|nr:ribonuclease HI [Flavobacteriaceae bacterium]
MQKEIHLYTDGAARGNPGPGGYGIVLEWPEKNYRKEFSEGFKHTTNNRMELLAVIEGLKKLNESPLKVKVYTDSKYVADAFVKNWVFGWEKKGFKDRKNTDLWVTLLKEYRKHKVSFHWVKGHNNHAQNERCDRLAVEASHSNQLKVDIGYTES